MDRSTFYAKIKKALFGGHLSQKQVDGFELILEACLSISDKREIAYILATVYHETAKTMQPVDENGKGKGRKYGKKLKRSGRAYTNPNHIYYGRGHVQLTWYENYELMGRLLGIPLLEHPELALNPEISVKILIEGMTKGSSSFGDFTGRCLEQYINENGCDYIGCRAIINGKDKAKPIAGYAVIFEQALN